MTVSKYSAFPHGRKVDEKSDEKSPTASILSKGVLYIKTRPEKGNARIYYDFLHLPSEALIFEPS